jgi:hypothetical protein
MEDGLKDNHKAPKGSNIKKRFGDYLNQKNQKTAMF